MSLHPDQLAFDLKTLTVFLAVAEHGSMTTAAENLSMSQSGVTKIIRRLEDDLGVSLLERSERPFRPTQAGQELLDQARALLSQAERLQTSVRELGDAPLPVVRIGLVDSFAATAGPGLVRSMRSYASNFTVWSGISPNLGDDLVSRKLDFIISTDPMSSLGGIEYHTVMREPFLLVMPERMAAAIQEPRLEDLARNHPFVRYSERSLIGAKIERHLQQAGISIPESLEFDGTESVFAMVSAGLGWAITTPLCLIHGFGHLPSLRAMPLPGRSLSRTLYLVARESRSATLPARIASDARSIAQKLVDDKIRPIAPWAADEIVVG
ncbi:MAG: LysR family transcriptional regulator [Rhodospirillales bacterium]|jgi:DNA-binding transcriptional LysR family regulator|nr:LysR family transcriptional regulator [Rhodospirillales bacterium]